jgi:hypothetical protein
MLLVGSGGHAEVTGPIDVYSLLHREMVLPVKGIAESIQLPDRFLLLHSEQVWINGRRLKRDRDYHLDYDAGSIAFVEPPTIGSTVRISYQRLPFSLRERYFHRVAPLHGEFFPTRPDSVPQPVTLTGSSPLSIPSTLQVGGSKTFAISLGSERDLSLEQSLRVNISGQISPDVEVIALL